MNFPRWEWEVTYDVLRSDSNAEFQTLVGFFNARQGSFDSFLYSDTYDNSVTTQNIGGGTGTATAFQLVRTFGGFSEPILAPNNVTAVYLNGASIPAAGVAAPAAPTLGSVAGGTIAATIYFAKITWVTQSGETTASPEASLAVALNNLLTVQAPAAPSGAVGFNVYVSTATGTETKQNGSTPIAIGGTWTEPTSGLVAGSAVPSTNTTGWSVSSWGTTTPGTLTFAGAPAGGVNITADFTYFWPCRFSDDKMQLNNFMFNLWSGKSIKFISIK
jgi:hypothetical protein